MKFMYKYQKAGKVTLKFSELGLSASALFSAAVPAVRLYLPPAGGFGTASIPQPVGRRSLFNFQQQNNHQILTTQLSTFNNQLSTVGYQKHIKNKSRSQNQNDRRLCFGKIAALKHA